MTIKDRYDAAIRWFSANMPSAQTELHYSTPFELIVAVMLSAQCTDRRVNMVTPQLLAKYPDAKTLASATPQEVFPYIKSISYPNSKADHLVGMARKLVSDYDGKVPSDIDELMTLPGVGRKTANVIASIVYDEPVIAVDTHVFRVSHRIGLSNGKTPLAVEQDLERHIPSDKRGIAHHWLILHGRYICTARNPHCADCGLQDCCKYYITSQTVL